MGHTLQISDGMIVFDVNGQLQTVTGNRKAAQDLGEALLQQYDPAQGWGSFLYEINSNQVPFINEFVIRYFISDAVQNLQSKQSDDPLLDDAEAITGINTLNVVFDGDGNCAFYLDCGTQDDGASVNTTMIQPTSFNQLFEGF